MALSKRLVGAVFSAFGWRFVERDVPDRCMIMGYSHTSNWDFVFFLAARIWYGKRLNFLGKQEVFRFGAGLFLKSVGGIPVNRSGRHGVVDEVVAMFARMPELRLAVSPEGTRKRTEFLKSGFYRMALEAGVPLLLARLDFATRTIDMGEALPLTGNVRIDMQALRARYEGVRALHPARMGALRMKDEETVLDKAG